jgi:hypothetical protein
MNRTSAILLLCAAGASINCSQASPTPTPGAGTGTAGSPSTGGAAPATGGGSTTTAGAPSTDTGGTPGTGGGSDMGGAPATGGTLGGGGAPPAGGGAAGAGTAGAGTAGAGGGAVTAQSIVPTFDGFLWVGKCSDATTMGKDCPIWNDANTCPSTSATANYFTRGAFQTHKHTVGGTPGTKYMVTFEARGVTGGKTYTGGTQQTPATTYSQTDNDGWYSGGLPTDGTWNTYELHVTPPVPGVPVNNQALTCTDCPTPPDNVYYLNSMPTADTIHVTLPMKFTGSFPVLGGGTITLIVHDSNCLGQQNCGPDTSGSSSAMCNAARKIDLSGLAVQPPAGFTQPYTQAHNPNPWYPQWLFFNVTSVTQP